MWKCCTQWNRKLENWIWPTSDWFCLITPHIWFFPIIRMTVTHMSMYCGVSTKIIIRETPHGNDGIQTMWTYFVHECYHMSEPHAWRYHYTELHRSHPTDIVHQAWKSWVTRPPSGWKILLFGVKSCHLTGKNITILEGNLHFPALVLRYFWERKQSKQNPGIACSMQCFSKVYSQDFTVRALSKIQSFLCLYL